MKNIGKNLKLVRCSKGLSQKQFAELLGISQSFYSEIETGEHNPSLQNLMNFSEKLNIKIEKLLK